MPGANVPSSSSMRNWSVRAIRSARRFAVLLLAGLTGMAGHVRAQYPGEGGTPEQRARHHEQQAAKQRHQKEILEKMREMVDAEQAKMIGEVIHLFGESANIHEEIASAFRSGDADKLNKAFRKEHEVRAQIQKMKSELEAKGFQLGKGPGGEKGHGEHREEGRPPPAKSPGAIRSEDDLRQWLEEEDAGGRK